MHTNHPLLQNHQPLRMRLCASRSSQLSTGRIQRIRHNITRYFGRTNPLIWPSQYGTRQVNRGLQRILQQVGPWALHFLETWSVTDLVYRLCNLSASDVGLPLAKPGTPLTAVVQSWPMTSIFNVDFSVSLFYVDNGNVVQQATSTDVNGSNWTNGSLTESGTQIETNSGSQIGAWWQACDNTTVCYGDTLLFFQATTGGMCTHLIRHWNPISRSRAFVY